MDGKTVNALTIILRSRGCSFAKIETCSMCGYNNDSPPSDLCGQDYLDQVFFLSNELARSDYVKIFTSGSFMDRNEVPLEASGSILRHIGEMAPNARILFESRPEFISGDLMEEMLSYHGDLEVAIGLESADDRVRSDLIGKRFPLKEYHRAADIVLNSGAKLKTYLILKPPFLSEADAVRDVLSSIRAIVDRYHGSTISVNPVNVQNGTLVEVLYENGLYRPPWLWSVVEILRAGKRIAGNGSRIISYPTGAGRRRGAHNCGKCDPSILDSIRRFDLSNDPLDLPRSEGCCRHEWVQAISSLI